MGRGNSSFRFIVACCGVLFFCLGGMSMGALKDPGLSEAEIRLAWKDFDKEKESARSRGTYPYMDCFKKAARKYDLPLTLLLAVARGESNFDTTAVSEADCYGIMQIKWPGTAKDLGFTRKSDLTKKPCMNIDAGARYLRWLMDRYNGDLYLTVAGYNRGPNAVSPGNVPEKGMWYAAYIYRHLNFVKSQTYYEKTGKLLILEFTFYKQALRNLASFENRVKGVPFEIFKSRKYTYDIFIIYKTDREREAYIKQFSGSTGLTPLEIRRSKGGRS